MPAMTISKSTVELAILPDDSNWKDKGCELSPSCLNCSLPRCIEEEPRGKQRLRMLARTSRMAQLEHQGKSTREIARLFHVSQRTVQRALSPRKATGGMRN
jgi:hypothetical protein